MINDDTRQGAHEEATRQVQHQLKGDTALITIQVMIFFDIQEQLQFNALFRIIHMHLRQGARGISPITSASSQA
jgi:hypothetical protein